MEMRQACTLLTQGAHASGNVAAGASAVADDLVHVTPEAEKTLRGGGARF